MVGGSLRVFLKVALITKRSINQSTNIANENILSIFHCNIRSLRNKLNYITDIIEEFDIVFFTETHLDNQVLDSDIIIEGFETP